MPYTIPQLQTLVDDTLADLNQKTKSPKILLQIKLLNRMNNILSNPGQSKGFCNAINCLEDGGYFPHGMIRTLVKLIPETSCGHTAILTALSLSEEGIDFSEFIDLMTRGKLTNNQLVSERKIYFDICPQLKEDAFVKITQTITEKNLIEMMMQSEHRTGLYLFTGSLNKEGDIGHIFIFIKGNNGEYYFSDYHKEVSKESPLAGGEFFSGFEYKILYGTFMYPLPIVQNRFSLRLKQLSDSKDSVLTSSPSILESKESSSVSESKTQSIPLPPLSSSTRILSESESGRESSSTSVNIMVGREGPGYGLHQVTPQPLAPTVPEQENTNMSLFRRLIRLR